MQIAKNPIPVFVDLDGKALEAGSIYIGTVNQNPETNPITAYWDSGLTQPAAQPIRTVAGMPVRNGTPSNIYTASTYSISVRNRAGGLVYNFPDSLATDLSGMLALDLANNSDVLKGDALVAFKQPFANAVASTVHEKLSRRFDVKDFGAVGDGVSDDTAAIQNAIALAVANGRGIVEFPAGVYLISSTLAVAGSNVVLKGAGGGATQIYRKANFGDSVSFGIAAPTVPYTDCGCEGIIFYHDTTVGGGVVAMTTGAAVRLTACVRFTLRDCYAINHFDGFNIVGGSSIIFDHLYVVGYNGVAGINGVTNTGYKISQIAGSPPAGTVPLPSKIVMFHCGMGGVPNKAANYCYHITAGEQVELVACEGSGALLNNLRIEQLSDNALILETSIRGGYYDTCGDASIWIGGPSGNGSAYIGNTQILGAIVKASGYGNAYEGIRVDGTARGGAFSQAVRGLQISDCNINTFVRHGVWLQGGNDIIIRGNIIRGNDYNNAGGSGLIIDANVTSILVDGNIIGGDPTSDTTGNQDNGIWVLAGASKYTICNNDLRGNVTNALLDAGAVAGTSFKRIFNNVGFNENRAASSPAMPASTVDLFNPFGSPAFVSIFGGTITVVKLNGQQIDTTSTKFPVGMGDRVSITYSVAPSWIWWPQ